MLILSQDSINSTFVKEELRGALESRAAGTIKQVLIFGIDQTSYKQLPDWMREINVAQHLRTAKQIARRIEASLTALSLDEGKMKDFYLPRDEQEESLRKLLAKPKRLVPNALHIVGNHGVGRKTFLRRTLSSLAPRQYEYPLSISVSEYDGLSEIFRKLYDLTEVSNPLVAGERFEKFRRAKENEKYTEIAGLVTRLADDGCLLMFFDEGGVYQDNGDHKEHFLPLLEALNNAGRPVISFVQTRMMREIFKGKYPKSAHIRLPSLSDKQTYELMCLLLNELDVEYEETEVMEACKFADGHPFNVHFIATYICNEGMDVTLADPGEILELNYQRGFGFISRIDFNQIEGNVLALLREYRFCELEFILGALGDPPDLIEAIRTLEDYCVVERRDRILTIAPPLKDAIRRDTRFRRDSIWSAQVATRVIDSLSAFTADDNIPLSLIDSAIPELIRSGRDIPFIANLILPSYFLRVARNYYDHSKWSSAAEFCRKALELEVQLSKDARTEANRLLGLALVRLDTDNPEVAVVLRNLRHYATPTANRVALFIEGFRARVSFP